MKSSSLSKLTKMYKVATRLLLIVVLSNYLRECFTISRNTIISLLRICTYLKIV